MKQTMTDIFNYLATPPSRSYTLGGEKYSFQFNRAARFVERVVVLPSFAVGAVLAVAGFVGATAGGGAAAIAAGLAMGGMVATFGKAAGLVKGAIAHVLVAGASGMLNESAKKATQKQEAPKAPTAG